MFIDSHCHIEDKKFSRDLDRVLDRAADAGVCSLVCMGDCAESSRKSVALSHRYENVYAAVGIHPHNARKATDKDYDTIASLADNPKVVAIGEIGLDYHYNHSSPHEQVEAFERQIRLAREKDLPLSVHCRKAFEDTLEILERHHVEDLGGIVHCFSGTEEDAKRIIDMGWYLGIGGPVTFSHAEQLRKVLEKAPIDRILIESDSPYLPPQAKRGRRNEPSYLKFVVKAVADIKKVSFQDLARATRKNSIRLFNLPIEGSPEIAYILKKSMYLNITNTCTNNCQFCHGQRDFAWLGHNLNLQVEPSAETVMESIGDIDGCEEVVFCGLGEPTMRLDLVLDVAKQIKEQHDIPVRLNTNGQGNLINGRNIVPMLAEYIDEVSISLNASTAEAYNALCRPKDPARAFDSILDFSKKAKKLFSKIKMTAVGAPGIDIEACRVLAEEKLKIPLRVREFVPTPKFEAEIMGYKIC